MITVLAPGLLSTVQDEGRMEFQAFGLPRAGVMDRYASRMANLLCGNPLNTAVVEMTMMGGTFRFERSCRIAVCGADMDPRLNGAVIESWAALDVSPGDILETGYAKTGCRSYLAVSGGFNVPVVMGSRSTYTRAGVGGVDGRALRQYDRLPLGDAPSSAAGPIKLDNCFIPKYSDKIRLRVLMGSQDDLFMPEGIEAFFQGEYKVTDEADRMGYRLEGPRIRHRDKPDIVSDALARGAVQVPGNGQPIVMMADCGTTGGYSKIATVIGADFGRLAQAKPQDSVHFLQCSDAEAVQALASEKELYDRAEKAASAGPATISVPQFDVSKMSLKILDKIYRIEMEEVIENDDD